MKNKELEQESSYVLQLSKNDIVALLKLLGDYSLNEKVFDQNGKKLPSIERYYNPEKNRYEVFIRCVRNNRMYDRISESLQSRFSSTFPFDLQVFNPNNTVILLSDYELCEIAIDNSQEQNKQLLYAKFMYDKFGEDYRTKYNSHITKLIQEQDCGREQ